MQDVSVGQLSEIDYRYTFVIAEKTDGSLGKSVFINWRDKGQEFWLPLERIGQFSIQDPFIIRRAGYPLPGIGINVTGKIDCYLLKSTC